MTESSGDLTPLLDRIMEEFSKSLSSLLRKLYAQSSESLELRINRDGRFESRPLSYCSSDSND